MDKLALGLLLGTDGMEDSLAVLPFRNVEFAGRPHLAVTGENLGLVAAGDTAGLAHFALVLEDAGEVRGLAVLQLVTRGGTVVGQHLQRATAISPLRCRRIGIGGG